MILLNILGAAALGHLGADFAEQWSKLPAKPFKCNMCMTWWLNIIPFIYIYKWEGILYTAIAAVTSELIYKQIIK